MRSVFFWAVASVVTLWLIPTQSGCHEKQASKKAQETDEEGCGGCFEGQSCISGACDGIGTVDVSALHAMLPKKRFQLVNVLDFEAGTIPGTDAHIPFSQIDRLVKHLGPDKKQPVVVYCRSIPKARRASRGLLKKGYRNIAVVQGGIRAWKKAGYELER
jgi:rhodanese-related sulfurtransferase